VLSGFHGGWRLGEMSEKGGGQRAEVGKGESEDLHAGKCNHRCTAAKYTQRCLSTSLCSRRACYFDRILTQRCQTQTANTHGSPTFIFDLKPDFCKPSVPVEALPQPL
jgi:hypothetical protein